MPSCGSPNMNKPIIVNVSSTSLKNVSNEVTPGSSSIPCTPQVTPKAPKLTLSNVSADRVPVASDYDVVSKSYKSWARYRESILDPCFEIINKLTGVIEDSACTDDIRDILNWCVEQLYDLQRNLDTATPKANRMQSQKRLNATDLVQDLLNNTTKRHSGSALVNYITAEYFSENIDLDEAAAAVKLKKDDSNVENSCTEWMSHYSLHGVHDQALTDMLDNLTSWDVDIFKLNGFSYGKPLTCVTHTIFNRRQFFRAFDISPDVFAAFLMKLEDAYDPNLPYHNSIHATDVVLNANFLLSTPAVRDKVTDLEVLATLVACAAHDVEHLGFSNNFLIKTQHKLADLYMESVMENHHYHTARDILKMDGCNITASMSQKNKRHFFFMLKRIILATDQTKHVHLVNATTAMRVNAAGTVSLPVEMNERVGFFESLVHACDLGNPTKTFDIYDVWIKRIEAEFFRQGDIEAEMGLPISPMCDSKTTNFMACQIGFIDYIVSPCWGAWARVIHPDGLQMVSNLHSNRQLIKSTFIVDDTPANTKNPSRVASSSSDESFETCELSLPRVQKS